MKTIELTDEEIKHIKSLCEGDIIYKVKRNDNFENFKDEVRLSKSILEKL